MARWTLRHSDRRARERWDAGLVWFRLRYGAPEGPRRAVALLSRPESAGRVALSFAPGPPLARLHIGIPARHAATLEWMARDMAFSVTEERVDTPAAGPLAPAGALPWERAFHAHVVDGEVFVDGAADAGSFLPDPGDVEAGRWQLPADPPAGVGLRPAWNGHRAPAPWFGEPVREGTAWPLGWGEDGRLLGAPGPVNVYGSPAGVAAWLVPLVAHLLATEPAGLIVLDAAGDLGPALKRRALVTRQLGRGLAYVDLDAAAVAGGFNPLASLPGEGKAETLARWQNWFAAMNVHPAGLGLLAGAQEAGIADIPALERWLEQPGQQHRPQAAHSLQLALQRLLADPHIREWLSWPGRPFGGLPEGALLFTCPGTSWPRRQLLRAALLAALQAPGARPLLHGLPWPEKGGARPIVSGPVLLSNGPLLPGATVVLAASTLPGAARLAGRFLAGDALWQEHILLLAPGEAIVQAQGQNALARWSPAAAQAK